MTRKAILAVCLTVLSAAAVDTLAQPQIWTHGELVFTKADSTDWNVSENQDRITDEVWITRQHSSGIFNIKVESEYNAGNRLSPVGTEWAVGSIDDWDTLTYRSFTSYALDKVGDNILTLGPSVVHLIDEDIYIAIEFTAWTKRRLGGGFSYTRTTFDPSPVEPSTWGAIKALYR